MVKNLLPGSAIVLFWAIMTGWLVRAHWNDGNAPFSDLPPATVFRQALKHEAASSLGIYRGRHRIGAVNLTPVHSPSDSVSLDGNISLPTGTGKAENYNFSLRFDLENQQQLHPETISLRLSRRQPALNAFLELLLKTQKIRYNIKSNGLDLGTQELPLSGEGFSTFAPALAGLPPLPVNPSALWQTLECRANRASFTLRGERMDGFRVSISAAGLAATATLGQLGELFILRTTSDYHLLADGLEPEKYLP